MRWHPDSGDRRMQHQTNWPEVQPVLDRNEEMVPPLPHTYQGLLPVDHFYSGCTLRIEGGCIFMEYVLLKLLTNVLMVYLHGDHCLL